VASVNAVRSGGEEKRKSVSVKQAGVLLLRPLLNKQRDRKSVV
jgi:hypothetical protein